MILVQFSYWNLCIRTILQPLVPTFSLKIISFHNFSGLDSSSTSQCVALLRALSRGGRTIVCTIHQPSALVYEMFDHVYILSEGLCIYQGSSKNTVPYLASTGLPCPQYHSVADYSEFYFSIGILKGSRTPWRGLLLPAILVKLILNWKTWVAYSIKVPPFFEIDFSSDLMSL